MQPDAKELVEALEGEWRDALCAGDWDRLETFVHHDFRLIGTRSSGVFVMNRDELLAAIRRRKILSIHVEVSDAVGTADMMVATIRARWSLDYLGQKIDDCVVQTDVWIKSPAGWQVVRRHSTPATCDI